MTVGRVVFRLLLVGLLLFLTYGCAIGLLDSFEDVGGFWLFAVGYAVVGLISLGLAGLLLFKKWR